jgi:hypothetical protein
MTDEELNLALTDVTAKLAKFGPEEKLSNPDWRQQQRLKREKYLLESIKKARESGNPQQEIKQMAQYTILTDERKMNPFLKYLMQLKVRSQLWW